MADSSELEEVLVEEEINHLEVILKHLPHLELAELAHLGTAVSQELQVRVIDLERIQRLATARPQDQGPWRSQLRNSQMVKTQCFKKGKGKGRKGRRHRCCRGRRLSCQRSSKEPFWKQVGRMWCWAAW